MVPFDGFKWSSYLFYGEKVWGDGFLPSALPHAPPAQRSPGSMTRGETLYAARVLRWIQCWTRQIARHLAQRPSWSFRPPDVVPRGLEAGGAGCWKRITKDSPQPFLRRKDHGVSMGTNPGTLKLNHLQMSDKMESCKQKSIAEMKKVPQNLCD